MQYLDALRGYYVCQDILKCLLIGLFFHTILRLLLTLAYLIYNNFMHFNCIFYI